MKSTSCFLLLSFFIFAFQAVRAAILPVSYDFGTDPGKTTYAAAGFTARSASGDLAGELIDVADGVEFRRTSGGLQSLGIVRTFTGLGGANTESFTVEMTGTFYSNGDLFNRPLGLALFADAATGLRTTGVYLGIEESTIVIRSNGNNGSVVQSATWTPGFTSGDNLTFTVDGIYTATDLNLNFTLSDGTNSQSLSHTYAIGNTTVDGTFFGASARAGNDGLASHLLSEVDTFSVAAIPEPGTLGLLALSGAALLLFRRRR